MTSPLKYLLRIHCIFRDFFSEIIFYPTKNIQKTKIMASSSITSWQIEGEIIESVLDFILEGSKITADGDCSR